MTKKLSEIIGDGKTCVTWDCYCEREGIERDRVEVEG